MPVTPGDDRFRFPRQFIGDATAPVGPAAGDFEAAVWAAAVLEIVPLDVVPGTTDENIFARRTRRMRAIAADVALVHVVQSRFERTGARGVQSFRRRARLIAQFEIRMKGGEMQRDVR